jgi:outer membrane immunogenic protein
MHKSSFVVVLCVAAGLSCTNVQAQDVYDWNGFYAGVFGGYNTGDVNYEVLDPTTGTALFHGNPQIDGFFGGIDLGFNYQLDNGFVVGAEADFAAGSTKGSALMYDALGGTTANASIRGTFSPTASLRVRAGFAVDRFMPFVTGGVALAETNFEYVALGAPAILQGLQDVQLGLTVGAGVEYAITDDISAKAEYRFSQFGGSEEAGPALGGTEKAAFHTHDARIGLNFHF